MHDNMSKFYNRYEFSGFVKIHVDNFLMLNILQKVFPLKQQREFHCLQLLGIGKFRLQSWSNQSLKYMGSGPLTVQPLVWPGWMIR